MSNRCLHIACIRSLCSCETHLIYDEKIGRERNAGSSVFLVEGCLSERMLVLVIRVSYAFERAEEDGGSEMLR